MRHPRVFCVQVQCAYHSQKGWKTDVMAQNGNSDIIRQLLNRVEKLSEAISPQQTATSMLKFETSSSVQQEVDRKKTVPDNN